jgi:hypothetical protein
MILKLIYVRILSGWFLLFLLLFASKGGRYHVPPAPKRIIAGEMRSVRRSLPLEAKPSSEVQCGYVQIM